MAGTPDQQVKVRDIQENLSSFYNKLLGGNPSRWAPSIWNSLTAYNPFLQNQRLKEINTPPMSLSKDELIAALDGPQGHEEQLRGAGWALSASQHLYYQILRLASDVPMYKWYKTPPLLEKKTDYTKKDYLEEDAYVDEWMTTFNPRQTFKRIAMEVKREGKPSYLLRNGITQMPDGTKRVDFCTLQKLPSRYVKLTAIGMYGYIASFDMMLFMNPAFRVDQYPDFIQDIWYEMLNNEVVKVDPFNRYSINEGKLINFKYKNYEGVETSGIFERGENVYLYWVQLPPEICYTFASDNSHPWAIPDTTGLFMGLQDLADYNTLASLVASTPLTMILTGEAETVNDPNAGRDQTVINPETIAAFQNNFNDMTSTNVEAVFLPFKNLKLQSVNTSLSGLNIASEALTNFVSSAGEAGVIVATEKPSVAQVKGAQLIEEARQEYVTIQFEAVLNMIVNKLIGCKYKWGIHLWGGIFTYESHVKLMKEMFAGGASFLLPKLASAFDMTMRDVKSTLMSIDSMDIYKFLKTPTQESKEDNDAKSAEESMETKKVGRPKKSENEIDNDDTAKSVDQGTNTSDMRDFAETATRCSICGAEIEVGEVVCEECKETYSEIFEELDR